MPKERCEEARSIYDLISKMERDIKPGSLWYIVSMKWIDTYQRYLYLDYLQGEPLEIADSDRVKPGPIDNKDIILVPPKGTYLFE